MIVLSKFHGKLKFWPDGGAGEKGRSIRSSWDHEYPYSYILIKILIKIPLIVTIEAAPLYG